MIDDMGSVSPAKALTEFINTKASLDELLQIWRHLNYVCVRRGIIEPSPYFNHTDHDPDYKREKIATAEQFFAEANCAELTEFRVDLNTRLVDQGIHPALLIMPLRRDKKQHSGFKGKSLRL